MLINRLLFCVTVFTISMSATCSVVSLLLLDSNSAADGWSALSWLWVSAMLLVLAVSLVARQRSRE